MISPIELESLFRRDKANRISELIADGLSINYTFPDKSLSNKFLRNSPSLVLVAAYYGATNCVLELISHGCKLNVLDGNGIDVSKFCAANGSLETAQVLSDNGVEFGSALGTAAKFGNTTMYFWILASYTINKRTLYEKRCNLLHLACLGGKPEIISSLLDNENEFDINQPNEFLKRPIHFVAESGNSEAMKIILSQPKIHINAKDNRSDTALHVACRYRNLEVVKQLVEAGANINAINGYLITPLHKAVFYEADDIVEYLLKQPSIQPFHEDMSLNNPFHTAVMKGGIKTIEPFVFLPSLNINAKNGAGATALHMACSRGRPDIVQFLLQIKHIDTQATDSKRKTPLHYAAAAGQTEVVALLIDRFVNVNMKDQAGDTPLHIAVRRECVWMVKEILRAPDADVDIENRKGDTPLKLAANNKEISNLLKMKRAERQSAGFGCCIA